MTRNELAAFHAGIALVASLAARAATAMRAREVEKPTRFNFAAEALQAIADEAAGLLRPLPQNDLQSSTQGVNHERAH